MLPPLNGSALPPGIHRGTWREIAATFGWNEHRQRLLSGLHEILSLLAEARCPRCWLDGSFVTSKQTPTDFDMCWQVEGTDLAALRRSAPVLWELQAPRHQQKALFGGDILPNVVEQQSGMPFVEFFQQDPVTGTRRGIVVIHLEEDLD